MRSSCGTCNTSKNFGDTSLHQLKEGSYAELLKKIAKHALEHTDPAREVQVRKAQGKEEGKEARPQHSAEIGAPQLNSLRAPQVNAPAKETPSRRTRYIPRPLW